MTKNVGTIDKIFRIIGVIIIAVLIITGVLKGIAAIILGIFGGLLLLTIIFGNCPVYLPFGISTCKTKAKEEEKQD